MPWSEPAVSTLTPALLTGVFLIAAAVSSLGSAWAIAHARRKGLFDQPGERRSHNIPTPRGGGIGIVAACLAALLAAATLQSPGSWLLAAAGLVLVAGIGWWDDHRPLPPWPRLLVHAIAAACLASSMLVQGAGVAAVIATFLLALVLVNAWNFMDGINGLAASQALLCALGFGTLLGGLWGLLALAIAGACLGFLPFNFPRARVFLGDVGSSALGYLVAALVAAGLSSRPLPWWPLLLLPPVAMLVDTGLTLVWRMTRGERWWQAHAQHAYQRWSRQRGHTLVCMAYGVWTFATVAVMLVLRGAVPEWQLAAGLGAQMTACLAWRHLHKGLM